MAAAGVGSDGDDGGGGLVAAAARERRERNGSDGSNQQGREDTVSDDGERQAQIRSNGDRAQIPSNDNNAQPRDCVWEGGTSTTSSPQTLDAGVISSGKANLVNLSTPPPPPPFVPTPPAPPPSEPVSKKCKTSEASASNVGEAGFDGPKFARKQILSHSQIAVDDAAI
nr:protein phosphatase 1 regulatory subunit 37-like [Arachis hypogaea]